MVQTEEWATCETYNAKDYILSQIKPYLKDSTTFEDNDTITIMIPCNYVDEIEILIWKYPLELRMVSNSEVYVYLPRTNQTTILNRSTREINDTTLRIGAWISLMLKRS